VDWQFFVPFIPFFASFFGDEEQKLKKDIDDLLKQSIWD
jgi:hypothetical protein